MSSQQEAAERMTKLISTVDNIQVRLTFLEDELERVKQSVEQASTKRQIDDICGIR